MPDIKNQLPAPKKKAADGGKNHLSKDKTAFGRGGIIFSCLPEGKIKSFVSRCIQKRKVLVKLRQAGKPVPAPGYTKPHICRNCKTRFKGNYCYNCGQSARVTRLNFSSVLDNLLDGMTNVARGSFFTILNLFTRPGYMINDYIKGKRIIFAKPFQMLFVLAAVYALCHELKYPENLRDDSGRAQEITVGPPAASGTETIFPDPQNKDKTFPTTFPGPAASPGQNSGMKATEKNGGQTSWETLKTPEQGSPETPALISGTNEQDKNRIKEKVRDKEAKKAGRPMKRRTTRRN